MDVSNQNNCLNNYTSHNDYITCNSSCSVNGHILKNDFINGSDRKCKRNINIELEKENFRNKNKEENFNFNQEKEKEKEKESDKEKELINFNNMNYIPKRNTPKYTSPNEKLVYTKVENKFYLKNKTNSDSAESIHTDAEYNHSNSYSKYSNSHIHNNITNPNHRSFRYNEEEIINDGQEILKLLTPKFEKIKLKEKKLENLAKRANEYVNDY